MHSRSKRVANLFRDRPAESAEAAQSKAQPFGATAAARHTPWVDLARKSRWSEGALWVVEPDLMTLTSAAVRVLEPG